MAFYPDIKKHISPSAFAAWFNAPSSFVKSYFEGEKGPDSAAMRSGKKIHALVEAGLLNVKHRYSAIEKTLAFAFFEDEARIERIEVDEDGKYELPEGALFAVYGIPDSHQQVENGELGQVFVDYKSGKENTWDGVKLAGDLKMKFTAWLVWLANGKPSLVIGHIEYIPTIWNGILKEIEPTGGESVVAGSMTYLAEDLEAFTDTVRKTVQDVNDGYVAWTESSDEFVDQEDVALVADLDAKIEQLETEKGLAMDRIAAQLEFGKKDRISTAFGSFYFTSRKKFEYPETLPVKLEKETITLKEADEIAAVAAAAKKKFETETPPVSITRSFAFRAKRSAGKKK